MKKIFTLNKKSVSILKSLLMTFAFLLICLRSQSQTITIPVGNTNTSLSNQPFGGANDFQRTAMIYTAAEIGLTSGTNINAISFFCSFNLANANPSFFNLTLTNTTQSGFTPSLFDVEIASASSFSNFLVFNGASSQSFWQTVYLTIPFIYTGNNLKITVDTQKNFENGNEKFYNWSPGPSQSWLGSLPANPISEGVVNSQRPNVQLIANIPENDYCEAAFVAATLPYSNIQIYGENATNNAGFIGCANPMNNGVWYKFAGTGAPIKVTISNVDATFDPQLDIYFGGCVGGNLGCIATADDGFGGDGETVTFPTVIGTNYFVNVGHYNAEIDLLEGNFIINIGSTLANNNFNFTNLKMFPNPVTNVLNIENSEKIDSITISNLLGQELINQKNNDLKTQIDLSSLQNGAYLVKVNSENAAQVFKIYKSN